MDPLTMAALGLGGGTLIHGITGGITSGAAARAQTQAAREAQAQQEKYYGQATGWQQPFYAAGQQGLQQLQTQDYTVPVSQYAYGQQAPAPYTPEAFNFQADPGYAFRLAQGTAAVEQGAAQRGAGMSGATQRALASYGQGLASQEWGAASDRYARQRQQGLAEQQAAYGQFGAERGIDYGQQQDYYNKLMQQQQQRYGQAGQLAGYGAQAAGNLSQLATGMGQDVANIIGQRGQARSAGIMGVGQSLGQIGTGLGQATYIPYANQQAELDRKAYGGFYQPPTA
jgi:hypothetical protein